MLLRRFFTILLCALIVMASCVFPTAATEDTETNKAVISGSHSIDAEFAYLGKEQLVENAQSVFMFETGSQTLMYSWKPDVPQYPAGLVKIMTALLVLENCDLSDNVTVSQSALDTVSYDAISIKLTAGETLSVEDLMYAMMVYAANDAASVLAEHTFGSVNAFVSQMNNRAVELGCTGTKFVNPHGLHDPQQQTTAKDICRILMAALEHKEFRKMFGTEYYTIPATNLSEERILVTNNFLMNTDDVAIYKDERVTGGRTGMTSEGYRCIASLSESGNMEVICIVMGCESKMSENGYSTEVYGGFPETIELLNRAYTNTVKQQFICADQILKQQPVLNGDSHVFLMAKESFSTVLPADFTREQLSFRYTEVPGSSQAPIEKGQNMASLEVWYGASCIAQTDVYAANDVPVAYQKVATADKKFNVIGVFLTVLVSIVLIAVLLVAVAAVVIFVLPLLRKKGKRSGGNRNRRS